MVVTQEPYKQIHIRDHQHRVDGQSTPLIEEVTEVDPWKADVKKVIPQDAGAEPLRCHQVDPRLQARKEKRMEYIQFWLKEERDDYEKLNKDLTENVQELIQNFSRDVKVAQRERSRKKQEMLTAMFRDTSQEKVRLYGDYPEKEFAGEFYLAWEKEGSEYDKRVTEEYDKQGKRFQQALDSEEIWKSCTAMRDCTDDREMNAWETVQQPLTRPPPDSPPFV